MGLEYLARAHCLFCFGLLLRVGMGAREVGDGDDRWEGGKEGPEMADGRWQMGDGGLVTKMRMCGPFSFASYRALGSRPWTWELGGRRWEDWEDDSQSRRWVGDCQICLLGVLILSSVLMLGRRGEYSIGYPVMVQKRGGNVWC